MAVPPLNSAATSVSFQVSIVIYIVHNCILMPINLSFCIGEKIIYHLCDTLWGKRDNRPLLLREEGEVTRSKHEFHNLWALPLVIHERSCLVSL